MDINSKMIIVDTMPTDCILFAPKEFIALIANYCNAINSKDDTIIDQAKLLMDAWLAKDNNASSICLLKNVGEKNG